MPLRLELGAGGGLIGLAVALECALKNPLFVTDQNEMFELMQHNVKLNNLQEKAQAMILNWYVRCERSLHFLAKPQTYPVRR